MDADLDTLATGLYVTSDDFLADNPQYRPLRPRVGLAPRLTDAELVTLVVLQALLGFTSEARFLRYANTHLRGLFPYLPTQSGYNKRIRAAIGTLRAVIAHLVARTSSVSDDVWVVDSTPVECGRSRETAKRSDLPGGSVRLLRFAFASSFAACFESNEGLVQRRDVVEGLVGAATRLLLQRGHDRITPRLAARRVRGGAHSGSASHAMRARESRCGRAASFAVVRLVSYAAPTAASFSRSHRA